MNRLSINLMGSFCVTLGGGPALQFKSSKDKALLAYLAVEADRPHARDKLAALFWPEMPDSEARSNLRYTLSSLRRTIGERDARPPTLLVDGDNIQFNRASSAWVDILELKDGLPQTQLFNVERVEKAVLLYRGPFLEGFSLRDCPEFETWLVDQQEQVSRLVVEALGRLANYYEHRHDYARALDFARPQVEMEPWEETAQRRLMRLLAFNGQRTEALAQYESLHKSLCAELNVEPEIETQRLVEQIRAQTLQPELEITSGRPIRGYELGERLGVGYMGAVYRAHQLGVGRDVAIKIIKPEYADQPDFIRRFELEARLVARLEHPNIVPLYDFWREPGGAFLVMRWLRGGNLADSIATKPWPIDAAVQLILQIASALHTAHQIGVIHRDIKPANILLDNSGNGYLSDFGIAALVEPFPEWGTEIIKKPIPVTTTSLGYTSPEVIAGAQPGPSADIYSLGVVLFELLTAQHPFPPESTSERNVEKHSQFLPSIQTVLPELPHSVDEVIGQATAVRSEDRYPDALALAHAFQQAVKSMAFFEINLIEGSDQMRNPYKGLRAFEEADQGEFFGRAALVEHLLERLNSEEPFNRFLAVVGPGGSGKSSLIRAGLIPRLRQGGAPGSNRWYFVTLTPGTQPFTELTLGLLRISVELQQDLDEDLRAGEAGLVRVAARILPPDAELLLVIDQFEELYTPQVDPGERENFLQMLCAAVTTPGSRVRLLIGLRADFYDRPLMHPQLSQFMQCRTDVIVSMTADELVAAIEEPARQVGAELEEGLTALLVADVNKQPGALPLLQYTLTELFERRERRLLTRSAYDEIGGVTGSLAQRTEEIYLSLDPAGRAAARQIFLRLVTFGEGVDETRRRVLRSDLTGIAGLSGVDALLDLFAENRLLTFSHDPLTRQPTVELAHEALLQAWGRLQDWLDESRADVHLQRLLANAAEEWLAFQRHPDYLLRGSRLDQLEEWHQKTDLALADVEKEYLDASLAERERIRLVEAARQAHERMLESRSRNRLRLIAIMMAIAALIAGLLSFFAMRQRQQALEAYSLSLTANAQTALESGDSATALVLALAAAEVDKPPLLTRQTLLNAAFAPGAHHRYEVETLFPGVRGPATALSISPDGRTLYLGFTEGTIIAWDWEAETEVGRLLAHSARVNEIAVANDGRTILSASEDSFVIQWDLSTRQPLRRLAGHTGAVRTVAISPDGRLAVSGGFANNAYDAPGELFLWDLSSGAILYRFEGHRKGVIQAQFVRSGTAILASSGDLELITDLGGSPESGVLNDSILWDVKTGEQLSRLETLGHDISAIALLPQSDKVLLASYYDAVATLFDLNTGEVVQSLSGHTDAVMDVTVGMDNKRALTSSKDGALILWDLNTGKAIAHLHGHSGIVSHVVATPDFRTAFSISRTGELMRWDLHDAMELRRFAGHGDMVWDVALTPDGQRLISVSGAASPSVPTRDTSLRVWSLETGEQLGMVSVATPVLFQVQVSPDGKFIMVDEMLFDASTLEEIGRLQGHAEGAWVTAIDISSDSSRAITGATDGFLIYWDLISLKPIRRIDTGSDNGIWAVSFGLDDRAALVESNRSIVDLWSLENGDLIRSYLPEGVSPGLGSSAAVFHPDGQSVFGAAPNGYIYRFDLQNGSLMQTFGPHKDIRNRVEISPDGKLMLTSGMDGVLMLWNLESGELIREFDSGGTTIFDITMSHDGRTAFSGLANGAIIQWDLNTPSLDELRGWISANRFVRELTCAEQELFLIHPRQHDACSAAANSH